MAKALKKNKQWELILKNCLYDPRKALQHITADQIKKSKENWTGEKDQFEPRLLCKIDHNKDRPQIFKDDGKYLLSVKNGTYAITNECIYQSLSKYNTVPVKLKLQSNLLCLSIGESETSLLDNLHYSGAIDITMNLNNTDCILNGPISKGPFLGGRHRISCNVKLGKLNLKIESSQYETDGCYETENEITVVEVKSLTCEDFNIRQIYYPFRAIYDKLLLSGSNKKVSALFIFKNKKTNIVHLYKYIWDDPEDILSLKLINYYSYIF